MAEINPCGLVAAIECDAPPWFICQISAKGLFEAGLEYFARATADFAFEIDRTTTVAAGQSDVNMMSRLCGSGPGGRVASSRSHLHVYLRMFYGPLIREGQCRGDKEVR
jgi:hypothetical protein